MHKSSLKSQTGSTALSSPRAGVESGRKSTAGSVHRTRTVSRHNAFFGDKSHERGKSIGGVKFSTAHYQPIFNEAGVDVTPRPLEKRSYVDVPKTTSVLMGAIDTPSSIFDHPGRSKFMNSMRASVMSMVESVFDTESVTSILTPTKETASHGRKDEEELLSDDLIPEDLPENTVLIVILNETDTYFLFELDGLSIQAHTPEAAIVEKRNQKYIELCASKETSDLYVDKAAQTLSFPPKFKIIQTEPIIQMDVTTYVTNWSTFDSYNQTEEILDDSDTESQHSYSEAIAVLMKTHSTDSIMEIFKDASLEGAGDSASAQITMTTSGQTGTSRISKASQELTDSLHSLERHVPVSRSDNLKYHLALVDRMINLNIFQKQLATYKHLPILEQEPVEVLADPELVLTSEDELSDKKSEKSEHAHVEEDIIILKQIGSLAHWEIENAFGLVSVWSLYSPKLSGMSITCITVNDFNPTIFGIGYGDLNFTSNRPGYATCWSLKNLRHPQRLIQCNCAITSMDFSESSPALLAVGLMDGLINLINVRENTSEWFMDSSEAPEVEIGPIWSLKWIKRAHGSKLDKTEFLVSACQDGHVCQWFLRKGMEPVTLMRVKPILSFRKWSKTDVSIAKFATIFCMSFHPNRDNIYLIGTGEGTIHECSCTNSDHFLHTYFGHSSIIYQVQWCPFAEELFVSCSGDWTIRIWCSGETACLMCFSSTNSTVLDVIWSPIYSTILASLHDKQLEVWDLSVSVAEPVSVYACESNETTFTVVTFSKDGQSLLLGDDKGRVTCLNLLNFPPAPDSFQERKDIILNLIKRSYIEDKKPEVTDEEDEDFSVQKTFLPDL